MYNDIRKVLKEYVDACELVKETENDIRKLEEKKKRVVQDSVKGSMHEFPYAAQSFYIQGIEYTYKNDQQLLEEEKILMQRKKNAELIRLKAQKYINFAPVRIQRIIRMKYIKKMSWNEIADRMGRQCTGDSVRMEFKRWIEEK